MNSFLLALNVVAPLFLLMLLGFLIRRTGMLDEHTVKQMNTVTFRILLPTMLFLNISTCDLSQDFDTGMILTAAGMSLVSAVITFLLAHLVEKDVGRRASLAQGMFRNNYILFGIPIVTAIYGAEATGYISMLLACIIPLNNIFAVIELQMIAGKSRSAGKVIKSVLTNPFVLASAAGFLFLFAKIQLPSAVSKAVSNVGNIANPLSLILLGACLEFHEIRDYRKDILIGVSTKLVFLPLLFLPILIAFGCRGERLITLFIAISTPAAVSSHVMAREMGGDGDLAGHLVVFGTAFSVLTIFAWICLMDILQLL